MTQKNNQGQRIVFEKRGRGVWRAREAEENGSAGTLKNKTTSVRFKLVLSLSLFRSLPAPSLSSPHSLFPPQQNHYQRHSFSSRNEDPSGRLYTLSLSQSLSLSPSSLSLSSAACRFFSRLVLIYDQKIQTPHVTTTAIDGHEYDR